MDRDDRNHGQLPFGGNKEHHPIFDCKAHFVKMKAVPFAEEFWGMCFEGQEWVFFGYLKFAW